MWIFAFVTCLAMNFAYGEDVEFNEERKTNVLDEDNIAGNEYPEEQNTMEEQVVVSGDEDLEND